MTIIKTIEEMAMRMFFSLVTTENQKRADERLPILLDLPARHKGFMAAPFIDPIDVFSYLATGQMEDVLCGGKLWGMQQQIAEILIIGRLQVLLGG